MSVQINATHISPWEIFEHVQNSAMGSHGQHQFAWASGRLGRVPDSYHVALPWAVWTDMSVQMVGRYHAEPGDCPDHRVTTPLVTIHILMALPGSCVSLQCAECLL